MFGQIDLESVGVLITHAHHADARTLLALSRRLRDSAFVPYMALERPGEGERAMLLSAVRSEGCTPLQARRCAAATRSDVLNGAMLLGLNSLGWCVELLRPDLVQELMAVAALEPWRVCGGRTAFDIACGAAVPLIAASRDIVEARRAAAACASAIALSPLHGIPDAHVTGQGMVVKKTVLYRAAKVGLPAVVERLLADPRVTPALVYQEADDGTTAFSAAAHWTLDLDRVLSLEERTSSGACAEMIAGSGLCDPSSHGGLGLSHFAWAARAGLTSAVAAWLADARVTPAVVNQRAAGDSMSTPFSTAAYFALDRERKLSSGQRASAAACARLIAADGRCDLSGLGVADNTHFAWAAWAGLTDVVTAWLDDPRVTADTVNQRSETTGQTAFSLAASAAEDAARTLSPGQRARSAACARRISASGLCDPSALGALNISHLAWAARAGLEDVVTAWQA